MKHTAEQSPAKVGDLNPNETGWWSVYPPTRNRQRIYVADGLIVATTGVGTVGEHLTTWLDVWRKWGWRIVRGKDEAG